jgi:hypothetical protein
LEVINFYRDEKRMFTVSLQAVPPSLRAKRSNPGFGELISNVEKPGLLRFARNDGA